jgi:hypothetical protein
MGSPKLDLKRGQQPSPPPAYGAGGGRQTSISSRATPECSRGTDSGLRTTLRNYTFSFSVLVLKLRRHLSGFFSQNPPRTHEDGKSICEAERERKGPSTREFPKEKLGARPHGSVLKDFPLPFSKPQSNTCLSLDVPFGSPLQTEGQNFAVSHRREKPGPAPSVTSKVGPAPYPLSALRHSLLKEEQATQVHEEEKASSHFTKLEDRTLPSATGERNQDRRRA